METAAWAVNFNHHANLKDRNHCPRFITGFIGHFTIDIHLIIGAIGTTYSISTIAAKPFGRKILGSTAMTFTFLTSSSTPTSSAPRS